MVLWKREGLPLVGPTRTIEIVSVAYALATSKKVHKPRLWSFHGWLFFVRQTDIFVSDTSRHLLSLRRMPVTNVDDVGPGPQLFKEPEGGDIPLRPLFLPEVSVRFALRVVQIAKMENTRAAD